MILLIVSAFRKIAEVDEYDALQWREKKRSDVFFISPGIYVLITRCVRFPRANEFSVCTIHFWMYSRAVIRDNIMTQRTMRRRKSVLFRT